MKTDHYAEMTEEIEYLQEEISQLKSEIAKLQADKVVKVRTAQEMADFISTELPRLQADKAHCLTALKAIVQNINEQIVHNIDDTVYDMAVAAIARAKGEA